MMITVITPTRRDYSFLITLGASLNKHFLPSEYNWIIIYNSVSQLFFDQQYEKLTSYYSSDSPKIYFCPQPGKTSSVYFGINLVTTNYFTIMNDKDILLANPIQRMVLSPLSLSDIGYCFPIKTTLSKFHYSAPFSASLINAYLSKTIIGDQLIIYETRKSLKYFFPPLFNEPYLPEDVKHLLAHQDSRTYLFIPNYILSRKYLDDGLTQNYADTLRSSPFSTLLYLYLTLKNITSLTDFRFFRVAIKIISYQIDTFNRPYFTSSLIILFLPLILFVRFWTKLLRHLITILK